MENFTSQAPDFAKQLLDYVPDIGLHTQFKNSWIHMTDTYSKFQIATFGSLFVHEVIIHCHLCINLCKLELWRSLRISIMLLRENKNLSL